MLNHKTDEQLWEMKMLAQKKEYEDWMENDPDNCEANLREFVEEATRISNEIAEIDAAYPQGTKERMHKLLEENECEIHKELMRRAFKNMEINYRIAQEELENQT